MTSGWPKEDTIRWVEHRLAEQKNERLYQRSVPDAMDLEIWLAKERDDQSWNQLARKYFPQTYRPNAKQNWAALNRARRARDRVERYLNPTEQQALRRIVEEEEQRQRIGNLPVESLYLCSPDYFEEHILGRRRTKRRRRRPDKR